MRSSTETLLPHVTSLQAKFLVTVSGGKSGSHVCAPVQRSLRKHRAGDSF